MLSREGPNLPFQPLSQFATSALQSHPELPDQDAPSAGRLPRRRGICDQTGGGPPPLLPQNDARAADALGPVEQPVRRGQHPHPHSPSTHQAAAGIDDHTPVAWLIARRRHGVRAGPTSGSA